MKTKSAAPETIDDYLEGFPKDVQKILEKIRVTISKAAPEAQEAIKYQIPTFTLNGNLVHFAAFKNHIGFYPAPRGIEKFQKELARYQTGKGTLQFPLDKPMPFALIAKVVKFRARENMAKAQGKKR